MEDRKRDRIAFWAIFAAAVLVRCVGFAAVPAGANQDEAMAGVDAWALSRYACDRFGIRLPVHFTAWKYGQMSVLLSYCMVPFIRWFGFGIFAVRLPMLLASCGSVALVYLTGKKLFSSRMALGLMLLTAINPWHFMQSRWSLDCNLFPHVFLLGFYLLLVGLERRVFLYLSMVFFGLTFYCYGIAAYSVPLFLAFYAVCCIRRKQLKAREVLFCILIFLAVALPEILVLAINFFELSTIETPLFTLSYFPESVRSSDILFLHFSFRQLTRNAQAMVRTCILQVPGALYNAIPAFGPMYHISIPFLLTGAVAFVRDLIRERDGDRQIRLLALWGFFLTGVWVGLITFEVNVNRINIIFFPLIFLCGHGIGAVSRRIRRAGALVWAAYGVCFLLFLNAYFTSFAEDIGRYFNVDFLEAVKEADSLEGYRELYITGHMDWQYNVDMAEILTQYACEIDAAYYQGKTDSTGGRVLPPYQERYHFVHADYLEGGQEGGLYLMHESELEELPFAFRMLEKIGRYCLLEPAD